MFRIVQEYFALLFPFGVGIEDSLARTTCATPRLKAFVKGYSAPILYQLASTESGVTGCNGVQYR
jgi:hypothetical protein